MNDKIKYYFGNMPGDSVGNRWTEKDIVSPKGDRLMQKVHHKGYVVELKLMYVIQESY